MALFNDSSKQLMANAQRALNEICCNVPGFKPLTVDGAFGKLSLAMVSVAQRELKLDVTGKLAGPILDVVNKLSEKYLKVEDLKALSVQYNIDYAVLRAIVQVESRGLGYLPNGNVTILFERHKFYSDIARAYGTKRAMELAAKFPQLVNTARGGYLGGEAEWGRLTKAIALANPNEDFKTLAYRSASWGLGQIMGFNSGLLKYPDVVTFVEAAKQSERNQADMIVRFCLANPQIVKGIKTKNWRLIAAHYNGSDYASGPGGGYHVLLEKAHALYA